MKVSKNVEETKIDWRRKLTSRKFWVAIIGFSTAMLTVLNINSLTIEHIAAIISALGTLVSYIISEGMTDIAELNGNDRKKPKRPFNTSTKATK
jgi:hypothetical protein